MSKQLTIGTRVTSRWDGTGRKGTVVYRKGAAVAELLKEQEDLQYYLGLCTDEDDYLVLFDEDADGTREIGYGYDDDGDFEEVTE